MPTDVHPGPLVPNHQLQLWRPNHSVSSKRSPKHSSPSNSSAAHCNRQTGTCIVSGFPNTYFGWPISRRYPLGPPRIRLIKNQPSPPRRWSCEQIRRRPDKKTVLFQDFKRWSSDAAYMSAIFRTLTGAIYWTNPITYDSGATPSDYNSSG